jgi:hypothetical protein
MRAMSRATLGFSAIQTIIWCDLVCKVTKKNMNNMSGIIIFFLPLLPIKQHKTLKL